MNKSKKVINNTFYLVISRFIPQMKSLITVPIYTRYLSPADYGIMSLISGFTRILLPITSFQIDAGITRYYFKYDHEERKKYLGTILVSVLSFVILFQLLFFVIGPQLISFVYPRAEIKYYPIMQLALITMFFGRIGNFGRLLLITIEKGKLLFIRNILKANIGFVLGLYFIVFNNMGLFGAYLAGTISALVSVVFTLYLIKDEFIISWDRKHFLSSLKFGIPIIPHAIFGMIFMYSDKIILEKYVPLSAIGLYAIADKLSRFFKTIVTSINNALIPSFMKLSHESKEETALLFKDIITKWAVIISPLFLMIVLFSEEVMIILTPPNFHSAYLIIPILVSSYIFRGLYSFSVNPLFFEKKTYHIPIITVSAGIINILLNLIFIPKYGIYAAAFSTLFSFFVTFLLAYYISSKSYHIEFDWLQLFKIFFPVILVLFYIPYLYQQPHLTKIMIKILIISIITLYYFFFDFGSIRVFLKKQISLYIGKN